MDGGGVSESEEDRKVNGVSDNTYSLVTDGNVTDVGDLAATEIYSAKKRFLPKRNSPTRPLRLFVRNLLIILFWGRGKFSFFLPEKPDLLDIRSIQDNACLMALENRIIVICGNIREKTNFKASCLLQSRYTRSLLQNSLNRQIDVFLIVRWKIAGKRLQRQ